MPLSHFKTLVKVQRINGVRLFTVYILHMDNCKLCSQPVATEPVQSQQNNVRTMFIRTLYLHYFADFEQVFAPFEGRIFININLVPSIFSL